MRHSLGCGLAFVLCAGSAGLAQQVVVPSDLATVEGPDNNAYPWTNTNASQRIQQVQSAAEFVGITGPHRITGLRLRPDASFAFPQWSNTFTLDLRLSTTAAAPDALSTTYADNVGADETTVFSGQATLSTLQSIAASVPGPMEFDIVLVFQTPFIYDPAAGNLLMDVRRDGHTLSAWRPLDGSNSTADGVSRLIANNSAALTGNTGSTAIVTMFVLEPVAGGCYANCDASTAAPTLNVADFTCFLQRFAAGESYANCDQSTTAPALNVADFTCFLQAFAAGCP